MPHSRSRVHTGVLLLMGCLGVTAAEAAEDPQATAMYQDVLRHRKLVVHPGRLDVRNRYRSVVQVLTRELMAKDQGEGGQCSGSLIGPGLVLTAAHCVCKRRGIQPHDMEPATRRAVPTPAQVTRAMLIKGMSIDAATKEPDCVKSVTVSTVIYDPPGAGADEGMYSRKYQGTVRAHPELEILFERNNIVWSNADLAVIFLSSSLQGQRLPVYRLTETEIQKGVRVTLVGHGMEPAKEPFGDRRFGENRVSWLNMQETGGVEFVVGAQKLEDGTAATHVDGGDSGGGCFRAGDNKVLVGVIGARAERANGEVFSVITSIFPHRKWLLQQIEEARRLRRP